MAQKLLLFWRKPARRCWWEGIELDDIPGAGAAETSGRLKVWIRRVWTLEMVSKAAAEARRLWIGCFGTCANMNVTLQSVIGLR